MPQVDNLLPCQAKVLRNRCVAPWQLAPHIRKVFKGELKHFGDLANCGNACQREQRNYPASLLISQVQQYRCAVAQRQFTNLLPELFEVNAMFQSHGEIELCFSYLYRLRNLFDACRTFNVTKVCHEVNEIIQYDRTLCPFQNVS